MRTNQREFFTQSENNKTFKEALEEVQEYISGTYSSLVSDTSNFEVKDQIKRYIRQYINENKITVTEMSTEELVDGIYTEMAEFSFLTKYISGTGVEEIDINAWNDVEIQYSDGRNEKMEEHFESPDHAINVVRRMLHMSGNILDNASPYVLGQLGKNIRIAVLKTPLVDEDVGVSASIRIVNPQNLTKEDFVRSGTATDEMLDAELDYMVKEPRKEFATMVGLVIFNIPLLYILNKGWYHTLMHTIPGQITLAVCGALIFISTAFVIKLTKPIDYKN